MSADKRGSEEEEERSLAFFTSLRSQIRFYLRLSVAGFPRFYLSTTSS
jgi:hypothetical protein